ncbi:MAG: acylneuraminate cytidylyltransferase family protein [Roseburia sp.]|nr:acylneuraminate cytidylyltransferase family protein [Roseburia sp.]
MKNLAVITARSGSKGLKDKNIKLLKGKPLMAYSIEAALETGLFDCVHVSTDSEQYAQIAREYGADVPFLRDAELATDKAGTWETIRAVVRKYAELGKTFETVTLLQPTSPLRDAEDIRLAFRVFETKGADSVVSVCEVDHSPKICNTLGEGDSMEGFIDTSSVGRRQDLGKYYRINGAIYIQTTEVLMNEKDLYGPKSYAYVMDKVHSVDIDDAFDFMVAEVAVDYQG